MLMTASPTPSAACSMRSPSLAALTLLAMVVMVTADIILRNLTRTGFPWANEVSEYALYVITLLTAPWLLRRGQHVRIDLVLTLVPARVAWLMEAVGDVLGFAVCLVMMRYGLKMTIDSAVLGSITIKNLVFPEWWLLWPLPLCFALLAARIRLPLRPAACTASPAGASKRPRSAEPP